MFLALLLRVLLPPTSSPHFGALLYTCLSEGKLCSAITRGADSAACGCSRQARADRASPRKTKASSQLGPQLRGSLQAPPGHAGEGEGLKGRAAQAESHTTEGDASGCNRHLATTRPHNERRPSAPPLRNQADLKQWTEGDASRCNRHFATTRLFKEWRPSSLTLRTTVAVDPATKQTEAVAHVTGEEDLEEDDGHIKWSSWWVWNSWFGRVVR